MWALLGLASALFLGIYDVLRKITLKDKPVIPVLFIASATGAFFFIPFIVLSATGNIATESVFYVPPVTFQMHLYFFLKSVIVGSSWFLAYFAISKLPLTIVIPIRATGPTWTTLGAILIYGERFTFLQWMGILVVLGFFYLFSLASKREGISFAHNKWILVIVGATLLGSVSGLYDKFLISQFRPMAVQAWSAVYMIPVFLPLLLFYWFPRRSQFKPFRWSLLEHCIGLVLAMADFIYFYALSQPGSLIAVLSIIRRSSVIISFAAGALFFNENNLKRKGLALAGILFGVLLIVLGTI